MMKYIKLLLGLSNIGLKKYLEYRWNTIGYITSSLGSMILSVFFIQIYYNFSGSIGGWDKNQTLLLLGFYRLLIPIFSMLFVKGITEIPNYIQRGELDIFLSKPVNSQFYISFRLIRIYDIIAALSGVGLIVYVVITSRMEFGLLQWIFSFGSLIAGISVLYTIFFCIAVLSVWLGRFESIGSIYYILRDPLSIPTDFYGKQLQLIMTFVLPMTFVLTVPVKILLGKLELSYFLVSLLVAFICLKFSSWFWNFALRHYTSASS